MNIFTPIPAPAGNGSGAWIDVSSYGRYKTITVVGSGSVFEPFVLIEASNELVPTHAFPLGMFNLAGERTFDVACHWIRATVSNFKGGGAPTVELGGTDDGALFAQLPVPAVNGVGGGISVAGLGQFKTVQVGGSFGGAVVIEISEDGGATYSQALSFSASGAQTAIFTANFMRVTRNGVPTIGSGLPDVWVGAIDIASAAPSAITNGIIFRPGVPSADNHVATWQEIKIAIAAAEGALTIYVDDSFAPANVPVASGVTDCQGATIIGYQSTLPNPNLTIDDGAQLFDVREIYQIRITGNPASGVPSLGFSFGGAFAASTFIVRGAAIVGGNGASPFISVPDNDEFDLRLLEDSDLSGCGPQFLKLGTGAIIVLTQVDSSNFPDGVIQGPAFSVIFLRFNDTVEVPNSYTGFAGFYATLSLNQTTGYPHTVTTNSGAFAFDSVERNDNYAVLVFGGGATTVTMPANPDLWEQHEIKNLDGVTLTIDGNGFLIEDSNTPGNYVASFAMTTIENLRYRFFPVGFTNLGSGVWTLV